MFEIMRPNRGWDKLENELSEDLKKILKMRKEEANGLCVLNEQGIKYETIKGKILSKAKPQCLKLDDMNFLEKIYYRKALMTSVYACDKCKKAIDIKKGFYNCVKCRYDLCLDCSGHNASIKE
jgi:hypothetical protein